MFIHFHSPKIFVNKEIINIFFISMEHNIGVTRGQ